MIVPPWPNHRFESPQVGQVLHCIMLMPLPICRTEHRESSSLSYPRRALIVLTALTLAAFISVGCQSGPRRNPLRHLPPLRPRLLPSQPPCRRGAAEPSQTAEAYRRGSSTTHSYSNAYACPSISHAGPITHGCGRTYSEPNSGSYSGADARGWRHTR